MKYISLIGDIVDSKKINKENREKIQENLNKDLFYFNSLYRNEIAGNLVITLGDEFQGLFYDAKAPFEVITYLQVAYPVKIRYGMGIGRLHTNLSNQDAIGSDGPCWWRAREAIDEIKANKDENTNLIVYGLENKLTEELINNALIFIYAISSKWTKGQKEILQKALKTYHLDNAFKQIDLANKYSIDASKVNRAIKKTKYFDYIKIIENIIKIINKEREKW